MLWDGEEDEETTVYQNAVTGYKLSHGEVREYERKGTLTTFRPFSVYGPVKYVAWVRRAVMTPQEREGAEDGNPATWDTTMSLAHSKATYGFRSFATIEDFQDWARQRAAAVKEQLTDMYQQAAAVERAARTLAPHDPFLTALGACPPKDRWRASPGSLTLSLAMLERGNKDTAGEGTLDLGRAFHEVTALFRTLG